MKFLILGAGGVGSYYGARLLRAGEGVVFVARGENLVSMQQKGLSLSHPDLTFNERVDVRTISEIRDLEEFDLVILTTKSNSTKEIAKELKSRLGKRQPYILSLQNGVTNEDELSSVFEKTKVIGGITRKIGAHIIAPGQIEAIGNAETIIGAIKYSNENRLFLKELQTIFERAQIPTWISENILLDLWQKLIINNGVNGICALLKEKTGVVMHNKNLSSLVYGLMNETATAAKYIGVEFKKEQVASMFELITNFDSIKPSMLVDREFKRPIELDDICNIVIEYCSLQGIDAPYTKTISYILEFEYAKELASNESVC